MPVSANANIKKHHLLDLGPSLFPSVFHIINIFNLFLKIQAYLSNSLLKTRQKENSFLLWYNSKDFHLYQRLDLPFYLKQPQNTQNIWNRFSKHWAWNSEGHGPWEMRNKQGKLYECSQLLPWQRIPGWGAEREDPGWLPELEDWAERLERMG